MKGSCFSEQTDRDASRAVNQGLWGVGSIDQILSQFTATRRTTENRKEVRRPFPFLLTLTPIDENGTMLCSEPITVVGKNLSTRGIGFYHKDPIPYRRVVLNLEGCHGDRMSVVVELCWCRFTRQGWYDSGGRFLERTVQENKLVAS